MENLSTTTRNVLIGVDIQNDFVTGSLAVKDGAAVIEPTNTLSTAIRKTGGDVILTRDWHPAETPHFGPNAWPVHCVADTEGADFTPTLTVEPTDIILSKGMGQTDGYSGWEGVSESGETLESIIEPKNAKETVRVFIGGLATDYCVKATGIDVATFFADDERVTTYLVRDAVRAVALKEADEANALKALKAAQVIALSTEEARALIEEV